MLLKPGSRLRSAVCDTEVMVVRAPRGEVDFACGGTPMVTHGAGAPADAVLDQALADGTLLGKRYTDEAGTIEVLCTKAGAGTLTVDGAVMPLKEAKPLPASD